MKFQKLTGFAISAALVAGLTVPVFAQDMLMGADAIAKRQELMKSNGMTLQSARGLSGAEAVAAADTLVSNFEQLGKLFPADSMEGDTKALPAIWNADGSLSEGFLAAYTSASDAAMALKVAAESGDAAAYGAAFGAMAQTCGGCHTTYRQPNN